MVHGAGRLMLMSREHQDRPLKILLVNDASTSSGGAEIMSLALRDSYRERGHEAMLFSSRALYGKPPVLADHTCFGSVTPFRQVLRVANPSAWNEIRKVLSRFRPDIVHVRMLTTQLSPLILPALRGYPTIYHASWHELVCPTGLKMLPDLSPCGYSAGVECLRQGCLSKLAFPLLLLQLRLLRHWRSGFHRVVANSHYLRSRLCEEGWDDVADVEVIWNGVPVVTQRPPLNDVPTIGFAGRLCPEKGAGELVDAFAILRSDLDSARLVLVGDGPDRQRLERKCESLGVSDSVTFTGKLSREQADSVLRQVWVQAVPSICQESFGLVAAEAQMRGTAVVATRRGALPEVVVDGETGLLVDAGSPIELAKALSRILRDKELAERLGQSGRTRAMACFRLDDCVSSFLDLYSRVLMEHRANAGVGVVH